MDTAFSLPKQERDPIQQNKQTQLKLWCRPLLKLRRCNTQSPFSFLAFWVSKSASRLCCRAKVSNGFCFRRVQFDGMVVNNSLYCASPWSLDAVMEALIEESGVLEETNDLIGEECGDSNSSSDLLVSETTVNGEEHSHSCSDDSSSLSSMGWPVPKSDKPHLDDRKLEKQGPSPSEIKLMKERFSKLLLGEDMSGCGNGVCTAMAISNAVTNLYASLFGQLWRLEPLPPQKKSMWQREMGWFLSIADYIVELKPSWQTFPDGSKFEVITSQPRSDLYINLPALRKLDNMLLVGFQEILDSFANTEFWYVDQGILTPEADSSSSSQRPLPCQGEKWWLPLPRVPPEGLSEKSRKQLQHCRNCMDQIIKAVMAINGVVLAEMEVPESYLETLPKNGRSCLGDFIYRYITSEQFSPKCLLDCLDLSSEHQALEIANRVEASIYLWRRRTNSKPPHSMSRSNSKSSWEMVKELVTDVEKRELLAERAESLLLCLKQRYHGLPQTTLDTSKIQCNKDVGKSILESYSRVLEGLASNIMARIDDLLCVDDLTKRSDQFTPISKLGGIAPKSFGNAYSLPILSTQYKTAFHTTC